MLITDSEQLRQYATGKRIWQGIPSIERTAGGRLYAAFYSGGINEQPGNFVVLVRSDDDGATWSEPIACAYRGETYRCYDQCLWIDPLGRLWFIWSVAPEHCVYASICADPEADTLQWGEVFPIGQDVMLNKPTVLSTGEWLFPIAVWDKDVSVSSPSKTPEKGAFVYRTADNGKTFQRLGCPQIQARAFDEHMVVELGNGSLMMLTRTLYGIAKAVSYDGGVTWTQGRDSRLGGPCSRFHIRRLASGRLLLVNHYHFTGRNNLTALLSEDDGKTWPYALLLDERDNVSYPDMAEGPDGTMYIIYDRERGAAYDDRTSFQRTLEDAREILMAKITEADILAGRLVSPGSRLKQIVSKLGAYDGDAQALYDAAPRHTYEDLKQWLLKLDDRDTIMENIFRFYAKSCENMQPIDSEALDGAIRRFQAQGPDAEQVFAEIIGILENARTDISPRHEPVVEAAVDYIDSHFTQDVTAELLAQTLGVSLYYLCHRFKAQVGLTILAYRDAQRMSLAKKLLCTSDMTITRIARECGFGDSGYFSRRFRQTMGLSARQYRQYHK